MPCAADVPVCRVHPEKLSAHEDVHRPQNLILTRGRPGSASIIGTPLCPTYNKPFNLIAEGSAGDLKLAVVDYFRTAA